MHQLYPLIFEDNKTLGLELEEVWKKSAGNKEAVAELMGRGHEQVPGKPIELGVLIDEAARNLIRQGNLTPIVDLEQRGGYDRLYDDLVSLAAGMYIKETREHKKQREALRNAPTAEAKQAWAQQASKTGAIRGEVASYLTQKRKGGQSY